MDFLKPLAPITFMRSIARILKARPQVPESLADNALLAVLLNRRSVRSFEDRPIPDDVFAAILEAGRVAPSTVNLQTWSFATFTPSEWTAKFGRPLPFKAARAIIILADAHRARRVLDVFPQSPFVEYTLAVMNASLSAMAMNVAAEALGVASVMLSETGRTGFLDAGYLVDELHLPAGVTPLMTIVFGYRSGVQPPMPPKLPLSEITFTGEYREADEQVMQDWRDQMVAGYKASHPGTSFERQLALYRSKIGQAEEDLEERVLGGRREASQGEDEG